MRLVVRIVSLTPILKWAQYGLVACAVLFLGYCGFALADTWMFQRRESAGLDRLMRNEPVVNRAAPLPEPSVALTGTPSPGTDGLMGRLIIPHLSLSVVVVEGIDDSTLRRAVGHIPGTALPGQRGNIGLAGHRDTLFRPLKNLRIKDEIRFSTLNGDFRYVVESLVVVDPENVGVLAPSSENMLTLVTCYPFYYIGPAPKRFVVRARQVPARFLAKSSVE
jgi:sortase A